MKINSLRGMRDILPSESPAWQHIEGIARQVFKRFGFREIRTPILEMTSLFKKSIGEGTDIVNKEMYSFMDKGGRDIALRPEGTAPVVRAYLQNNLGAEDALVKLYYMGPMFRSERPQKGRSRQFYQIGVEALGSPSPYLDAEIIIMMDDLFKALELSDYNISLGCLGCGDDKKRFSAELAAFLKPEAGKLCDDCKTRLSKNVLRVMDCKVESCKALLREAPSPIDSLCKECGENYATVKDVLKRSGVDCSESKKLVRGLDYYTGTVFEVAHSGLGAQDAICAGGRYDNLVNECGGRPTPAVGFALGVERVLMALECGHPEKGPEGPDLYIAWIGKEQFQSAFDRAHELRKKGVVVEMGFGERSLKAHMKQASKIAARYTAIYGSDEGNMTIDGKKGGGILGDMRTREQENALWESVFNLIERKVPD